MPSPTVGRGTTSNKDVSAGHKKQEELNAKIPLSFILVGKKDKKTPGMKPDVIRIDF